MEFGASNSAQLSLCHRSGCVAVCARILIGHDPDIPLELHIMTGKVRLDWARSEFLAC